jgi:hypothetical protein
MTTSAWNNFSLPKNMMVIIFAAGAGGMAGIGLEHDSRFFGPRAGKLEAVNRAPARRREMMGCATRRLSHHPTS